MEYNGIKLTEVTKSQIVDPPKKMLVWDYDPGCLLKADVLAIVNGRESGYPVITKTGTYRHCAEIPEKPKPRRATNRELSKWLAKGHGEYIYQVDLANYTYTYDDMSKVNIASNTYTYDGISGEKNEVPSYVKVRKWEDADWHEPTVDYMGIEY